MQDSLLSLTEIVKENTDPIELVWDVHIMAKFMSFMHSYKRSTQTGVKTAQDDQNIEHF